MNKIVDIHADQNELHDLKLKKQNISNYFAKILAELGLDLDDPSIKDTPNRVAKMLVDETCNGLFTEPPEITTFPIDEHTSRDLIVIEDIPFSSLCEHHFQPFIGKATVAYLPNDRIMGLSKAARVLDYFAARPQVQERLTGEVAQFLYEQLNAKGVLVIVQAEHFCMKVRGVKKHGSSTITTAIRGDIDKQEVISSLKLAGKV
ncbi:GTP cyclohydrolase I FolE [Heyndrickxia ginsengihumi]|uniref:GTP cyclohydrolase 1 n=1 Tax=Heyndrickxia ginsengihumi TaxID=363870 RepID=A0A6M0P8K9_9BACI|nr:GTP cyclohydrolase I FolE [Heyndrickxia ginsengihumi]MBE6185412.1 GTP cyclohydrolase I FolE [Bacillus sp. (in: firmicutes)]MCM3021925.1 GTP cyclohydrolase I FolE [Heyndrickxia ginsengihumi]NEY20389.1 GTP cyclohydrolase I FolE [Heyndrickxia ginsengihumi]